MSVRETALVAAALVAVLIVWLPVRYMRHRSRMPRQLPMLHGTVRVASVRTRPRGPDSVIFQLAGSAIQFRYFGRDRTPCQTVRDAIDGQTVSVWYELEGASAGLLATALRIERADTLIVSAEEGLQAFKYEQFTILVLVIEPTLFLLLAILIVAVGR